MNTVFHFIAENYVLFYHQQFSDSLLSHLKASFFSIGLYFTVLFMSVTGFLTKMCKKCCSIFLLLPALLDTLYYLYYLVFLLLNFPTMGANKIIKLDGSLVVNISI